MCTYIWVYNRVWDHSDCRYGSIWNYTKNWTYKYLNYLNIFKVNRPNFVIPFNATPLFWSGWYWNFHNFATCFFMSISAVLAWNFSSSTARSYLYSICMYIYIYIYYSSWTFTFFPLLQSIPFLFFKSHLNSDKKLHFFPSTTSPKPFDGSETTWKHGDIFPYQLTRLNLS